MKNIKMNKCVTVESPDENIRAELSFETFWSGNTVYPSAAVLTIWYRGYPVIAAAPLMLADGNVLYGLELDAVDELTSEMRLGTALQKSLRLKERGFAQREIDVVLRVSDLSVFFDINLVGAEVKNCTFLPAFVKDAPCVSLPSEIPSVAYVGAGALAAMWPKAGTVHLVVYNRPGKLAEMRFGLLDEAYTPVITTGMDGCRILYAKLPFLNQKPAVPDYSDQMRLSYRLAFDRMLEHYSCEDDDFWVLRGDPCTFVVIAMRVASKWVVCGLTHAARTLTVRFEELWLRLPLEMQGLQWSAVIQRDPVLDESGEIVEESFDKLAPDVRIALDLKKNGGFVIVFEPMKV